MKNGIFQFDSAARLYVENYEVISLIKGAKSLEAKNLIKENDGLLQLMRSKAYNSVANFGSLVVECLLAYDWRTECLGYKKTSPVKSFAGGNIHYFWLQAEGERISPTLPRDICRISFGIPISERLPEENDDAWTTYWGAFDPISTGRLKAFLSFDECDPDSMDRVLDAVEKDEFGTFFDTEEAYGVWIPIDPEDPVGSVVTRYAGVIRTVWDAEREDGDAEEANPLLAIENEAGRNSANLLEPSAALAEVVGSKPLLRSDAIRKMWQYIKKNELQDAKNSRSIIADSKLKAIFGKGKVSMFEIVKLINKHLRG